VISKNKELREENALLKMENTDLKKKCNKTSESLENEKAGIKKSIEDLLASISSLEKATNKEDVK
jgi:regulator of replication initiation timing